MSDEPLAFSHKPDPMREENERREKLTASLIAYFEEASEHIAKAAKASQTINMYTRGDELVQAVQSMHATLWHVLDNLKFERGPQPTGFRTFPGLDTYLEQHPQKEPGANQP